MKKFINIIFIALLFIITGCNNKEIDPPVEPLEKGTLGILTINDLHGAIVSTNNQPDISLLAGEIKKQADRFDECIMLAGGDMWQGTAISNINRGALVTDIMNEIGFDGMVIGNHEFDWGIDEITKFKDGNRDNGEADFPFLAANIFDNKGTSSASDDELVDFASPYMVLEKGAWKIGVIGYIGKYQKYDIAASIVKNYDFKDPVDIVLDYAEELSSSCDLIIVYGHDYEDDNNLAFANSPHVDVIYNAHTHRPYINYVNNKIVMQSASNGNYLGVTSVTADGDINAINIKYDRFKNKDLIIEEIVNNYKEACYNDLYGELNRAGTYCTRNAAGRWAATTIKEYTGADFGIQNNGGIRSVAFPIDEGYIINVAKLYDMMPFDNTIWLVKMTGSKLKNILSKHEDYRVSYNYNESLIVDSEEYIVACCDYIVDGNYDFNGLDVIKTGLLVRDAMIDDVLAQKAKGMKWSPFNTCVDNKYN